MKMIRTLFALSFIFIATSCEKQGPEGPAGATGPVGPTGATGPTGAVGTANVIYSAWTSFATANWSTPSVLFGVTQRTYPVTYAPINAAILNNGVLLVYYRFEGTGPTIVMASPLTFNYIVATGQVLRHEITTGGFNIIYHNLVDITTATGVLGTGETYRFVVIPGGVAGRNTSGEKVVKVNGQNYSESQLVGMPYSQMCSLLNIQQ